MALLGIAAGAKGAHHQLRRSTASAISWLLILGGIPATYYAAKYTVYGSLTAAILICIVFTGLATLTKPTVLVAIGGVLILTSFAPFAGIPINELGAACIVAGAWANSSNTSRFSVALLIFGLLAVGWFTAVGITHTFGSGEFRRLLHLLLWISIIITCAAGKLPRRPLTFGIVTAVYLQLLTSISDLEYFASSYEGRAVGAIGDPNSMAAIIVILTPLVLSELRRWWSIGLFVLASGSLIFLAQSRTGLAAWLVAMVVYLLLPRWRVAATACLAIGFCFALLATQSGFASEFFADRAGSDVLRERILAASRESAQTSPWNGHGLSSAKIDLPVGSFYFHNSYFALFSEIGLVGFGIVLAILVIGFLRGVSSSCGRAGAAGLAGGFIMATQLGEVLLDLPIAIAAGIAWARPPAADTVAATSPSQQTTVVSKIKTGQ